MTTDAQYRSAVLVADKPTAMISCLHGQTSRFQAHQTKQRPEDSLTRTQLERPRRPSCSDKTQPHAEDLRIRKTTTPRGVNAARSTTPTYRV